MVVSDPGARATGGESAAWAETATNEAANRRSAAQSIRLLRRVVFIVHSSFKNAAFITSSERAVNTGDEVRWINKRTAPVQVIFLDAVLDSRLLRRGQFLETWREIRLRACYLDEVLHGEDSLRLAFMPANSLRTSLR
jgi:hypothetical protein